MKKLFTLIMITLCSISSYAQMDSLQSYYNQSIQAYESGDYELFLKYSSLANQIRPNHPTLAYNAAAALALNGKSEEAISSLRDYIAMNADGKFMLDSDFESLKELDEFQKLNDLIDSTNQLIENSLIAFTVPQDSIHYESIAYYGETFFLGGVHSRSIYTYIDGRLETFASFKEQPDLFSVMGLAVSPNGKTLWVCTAALPEMMAYQEPLKNSSSLMVFDIKSKKLLKKYIVEEAILGDLIVDDQGSVITSDGLSNRLFLADLKNITVLKELNTFNLQGLALNADKKFIYFADYISGLYRMDLKSLDVQPIKSKGLFSTKGIDGILVADNTIIAFQNGTNPKRTIAIEVEGIDAKGVNIIDQNLTGMGEPTQGTIVDGSLYYLSNSSWDAYTEGSLDNEKVMPLNVRSVPLSELK